MKKRVAVLGVLAVMGLLASLIPAAIAMGADADGAGEAQVIPGRVGVLFKDSVTLVQRLILLGKDVDLVALPDAGHGWDNEGLAQTRFAFKKLVGFFDRHLKGEEP